MPDIFKIKLPDDDTVYNIKPAVMDITPTDGSDNPVTSDGIYEALNNMKMVVLSYGNSTWDDFLAAYTNNKVVYCRASSNSNPATDSQTRMAFLAYVNDSTNPTEGEFQYYRSINSHTDSTQGDEVYVYKINKTNGWSVTTRRAYTKVIAGTNLTSSFTTGNNSSITLNHATSGVTAGTYDTVTVDAQGHATTGSNSRVSNVTYDTTNSPVLKETIGGTDSTIETPDTTPTDSSKHLITSGGVYSALSDKITIDDVFGYGTEIEANSDLNNYTTIGQYYVGTTAIAEQITHMPTYESGQLTVSMINEDMVHQQYVAENGIWNRFYDTSETTPVWSDWVKIFDSSNVDLIPAENSTNLVESGGVWSPVSGLIDNGAKNIIKWIAAPTTTNNVKFIPNSLTNEIAVSFTSGTSPTSNTQLEMNVEIPDNLSSGTYVLGGSIIQPSGGLVFKEFDTGTVLATVPSSANHVEFEWTPDSSKVYKLYLNIGSTQYIPTGRSITYKPFICTKTDWDISQESAARALNNPALTSAVANVVNQGRKNYLNVNLDLLKKYNTVGTWSGNVYTVNDMTFTVKGDGTIIAGASGNVVQFPSENTHFYLAKSGDITITEPMVLSSGLFYNTSTFYITWGTAPPYKETETRKGVLLIPGDAPTTADIIIEYPQNSGINNYTWKPMLCTKAMWDVSHTYESYALSNPVLTAGEIELVDNGAKNLLHIGVSNTTFYTATVTVNASDGSITLNGTTTNQSSGVIYQDLVGGASTWKDTRYTLPAGEYGCRGSNVEGTQFQVYCHDGTNAKELFNSRYDGTFTYSAADKAAKPYITFRIGCNATRTFSNATIYPMVCTKVQWDISQTFEPYALPNSKLTATEIELVDNGAKNRYTFNGVGRSSTYGASYTDNGVTYTMNADGSISTSGTAGTDGSYLMLFVGSSYGSINSFCDGAHVLSGSTSKVTVRARANSTNSYLVEDTGSGAVLTTTTYTGNIFVQLRVLEGVNATGETVYPMICSKAQWDVSQTYKPYAMTNPELTAQKVTMDDIYGLGTLIPNGSDLDDYTTLGSFYVINSANADTILHKPIGGSGFRLIVSYTSATNRPRQEFIKPNQPGHIYVRNVGTDGNWSNWYIFDTLESGLVTPVQKLTTVEPELVDNGAKNVANWTASTSTINNVKFAVSGDTVTVTLTSGTTATARSQKALSVTFRSDLPSGQYVLSGAPSMTAGGLYLWDQTAVGRVTPTSDMGNGTTFTFNYDPTHVYNLSVDIANGYTIASGSSLVFKPMICTKAQWDISQKFVPYCPTMAELYQMILALQ